MSTEGAIRMRRKLASIVGIEACYQCIEIMLVDRPSETLYEGCGARLSLHPCHRISNALTTRMSACSVVSPEVEPATAAARAVRVWRHDGTF